MDPITMAPPWSWIHHSMHRLFPTGFMEDIFKWNLPHLRRQLGVESFSFWDSAAFCLRLGWKGLHIKRLRVKSTVWSCYSGDCGAVIKKPDLIPNQGARLPTACLLKENWPHTPLIGTDMILYTRKHTILGITHSRSKTHQTKTAD